MLEEHSSARADAAAAAAHGQAGGVTEVSPVLPAERLATQCHQDAVLALASVEVCCPLVKPRGRSYIRVSSLTLPRAAAQVNERLLLSCSQDGIIKAWK